MLKTDDAFCKMSPLADQPDRSGTKVPPRGQAQSAQAPDV